MDLLPTNIGSWLKKALRFRSLNFKAVEAADENPIAQFKSYLKNHMKFLELVEQHSLFHALPSCASPDNSQIQ